MDDKGSLRTPLSILAIVIAALLGWILKPVRPLSTQFEIGVAPPDYYANPETQPLSMSKGDSARWVLKDGSGTNDMLNDLYIEFEKPEVFPTSKVVAGSNPPRYRVPCSGPYCLSGPIGSDAHIGEKYKYWQVISGPGGPKKVDGHIIINR